MALEISCEFNHISVWWCLIHVDLCLCGTCIVLTTFQFETPMWHHKVDVLWWPSHVLWRCWSLEGSKKQTDTFYVEPWVFPKAHPSTLWAQFAFKAQTPLFFRAMKWTSLVFLPCLPVSWACSYVELPWQANQSVGPSYLIARTMELSNLYGTTEYSIEAVPRGDSSRKWCLFSVAFWKSLVYSRYLQFLWKMKKWRPGDLVVTPISGIIMVWFDAQKPWGAFVLLKPPGSKHGNFGYVAPMNHLHFDGLPFQVPFEGMNEQGFRAILRSDFLFGPKGGGRWYPKFAG